MDDEYDLTGLTPHFTRASVDLLHVKELEIHNNDGDVVMQLTTDTEGSPALTLRDKSGAVRVQLDTDSSGRPGLTFRNQMELAQVSVFVTEEDEPIIKLFGRDGRTIMAIYASEDRPSINLYDAHEDLRLAVYLASEAGSPMMLFGNQSEDRSVNLTLNANNARLAVVDHDDNERTLGFE